MSLPFPLTFDNIYYQFIAPIVKELLKESGKNIILNFIQNCIETKLKKQIPVLTVEQSISMIIGTATVELEQAYPSLDGHSFLWWERNVKIFSQWILEGCDVNSSLLGEVVKYHKLDNRDVLQEEFDFTLQNIITNFKQIFRLSFHISANGDKSWILRLFRHLSYREILGITLCFSA